MDHTIKTKVVYLGKGKVGMIGDYKVGRGMNNHNVIHTYTELPNKQLNNK